MAQTDADHYDLTQDDFQKAVSIARFLHRDESIATTIVLRAVAQLEGARETQDKRSYYYARRDACEARPYKLKLATTHLLQKLVFTESERFELASERDGDITERDMRVRYLKHLILLSIGRNAFYASIAVACVLYDYSIRDAMEIHMAVDDSDVFKEPSYYRSRRQRVLAMLHERFGHRLLDATTTNDAPASAEMLEALEALTPWDVTCAGCGGETTYDEITRLHVLFRPRCFAALAKSIGVPPPRIRVPLFDLNSHQVPLASGK